MIWVALLLMLVAGAGLIVSIALLRDHCPPPPTINLLGQGIGSEVDLADTQDPLYVYRFRADRDPDGAWVLRKVARPR